MTVDPFPLKPVEAGHAATVPAVTPSAAAATPLEATLRAARVAIAAVLLAAIGLNIGLTWRSDAVTDRLQRREIGLVLQARALGVELAELMGAGRGYLVAQDPRFLTDLAADEGNARAALDRLRSLAHTAAGRDLVTTIGAQLEGVIDGVERRVALAQAGRLEEARTEFIEADDDRRLLLGAVDELVMREERLLATSLDELQRERVLGLIVGAALLVGVGVVALRYLTMSGRAVSASQAGLRAASGARDRALAALQTTMREREALIASISHDLKNPLTAVQGQAQLLRRRAAKADGPEMQRMAEGLATIDTTAKKLARLIDELGDTVRLEMGSPLDLRPVAMDLSALARQAVTEYQQATDRHTLCFEAPDGAVAGVWDGPRLERVMGNLLTNAIKYSPAGGAISVRVGRDGDVAVLEVGDRGIGIPPANLGRVFDRYHRAANVKGVAGSGLGLAGARLIVEGHGGTITVASEVGVGSRFTVRLPLGG